MRNKPEWRSAEAGPAASAPAGARSRGKFRREWSQWRKERSRVRSAAATLRAADRSVAEICLRVSPGWSRAILPPFAGAACTAVGCAVGGLLGLFLIVGGVSGWLAGLSAGRRAYRERAEAKERAQAAAMRLMALGPGRLNPLGAAALAAREELRAAREALALGWVRRRAALRSIWRKAGSAGGAPANGKTAKDELGQPKGARRL
jgi:hypothetical protein